MAHTNLTRRLSRPWLADVDITNREHWDEFFDSHVELAETGSLAEIARDQQEIERFVQTYPMSRNANVYALVIEVMRLIVLARFVPLASQEF